MKEVGGKMLTPLDISNKEFKKAFRGYKEDEVDEFLDKVIADYERLYKENGELKDRISITTKVKAIQHGKISSEYSACCTDYR